VLQVEAGRHPHAAAPAPVLHHRRGAVPVGQRGHADLAGPGGERHEPPHLARPLPALGRDLMQRAAAAVRELSAEAPQHRPAARGLGRVELAPQEAPRDLPAPGAEEPRPLQLLAGSLGRA
jgi:hypothetical protein